MRMTGVMNRMSIVLLHNVENTHVGISVRIVVTLQILNGAKI